MHKNKDCITSRHAIRRMVWSGYVVLMSEKTNSIKKQLGCLSVKEREIKDLAAEELLRCWHCRSYAWYLKGTPSLGLWYPECSSFDLKGYSDSDYVGYNMDKKSTSGTNVESSSDEISKTIKLEDLSKLMQDVKTSFIDLDSPEDETIIVSNENEMEEEADKYEDTHATSHEETEDSLVPHPSFLKAFQLREVTNQVMLLQSQIQKLQQ
nr:uncharacterized mitochondrial protein AtMg00810-like [Tanacetum cinerariifolium]